MPELEDLGMLVVQLLFFVILTFVVPLLAGLLFVGKKNGEGLLWAWISGQIALWAGFQCICVPMVLAQKSFLQMQMYYLIYAVLLAVAGVIRFWVRERKGSGLRPVKTAKSLLSGEKKEVVLWAGFTVLLLLQLVLAVLLAYEEGDDAYYVAVSTITVDSDMMYDKLPYTGGTTLLDARHGLAPFPVWVAHLAAMTGLPAVSVAQIALPLVLILMTYGLYGLLGRKLLTGRERMLPLFMIFVELMVLFGGYTTYTAENFLLVRTAQGKAVIANVVIPFMLLLFWMLLEQLKKGGKLSGKLWLLLAMSMLAGCLCSTQGTLLTCILVGTVGGCSAVCYRRWRILLPLIACCMIPAAFAVLYFRLD